VNGELDDLLASVPALDEAACAAARAELDGKTKPRGSLGRLESLAVRIAGIRGTAAPGPLQPVVVVAAADHGVVAQDVSAYPQEVTAQMLANFASGGAAICVLVRVAGAELVVVDAGVATSATHPGVRDLRIGPGTSDATQGPAMSRERAVESILRGATLARELTAAGHGLVALGEMGIGNTTSASAIVASLLDRDAGEVCGPGTGLGLDGVARKAAVVRQMLDVNGPVASDPVDVLRAVGGFEIGLLAGVALGAAAARSVVLLDGFITTAAALVAVRLAPPLREFLVAGHRSPEPGHAAALDALGLQPLLDLGLRLGEGSGAALALPLLDASVAILREMASFADAGVTDTGR
jgi:nicotinate-nucleotide--dimethylbenzimidazole phosphoribosyltransferase